PAYTTLTIFYNPETALYERIKKSILQLSPPFTSSLEKMQVKEIPVCYEEPYALDLQFVADSNGLSIQDVIQIHTSQDYPVYFLGFTPGFPFLGGMDSRIAAP